MPGFFSSFTTPLDPSFTRAAANAARAADRCTPCPCPGRQGWNDLAAEVTAAQNVNKGVGEPLRFRIGPGASDVAKTRARSNCLAIVAVIVVVTIAAVAIS